jgi:hypothetical protein
MTVLSRIETSVDSEAKQKPNTPLKATETVNNMVNRQSRMSDNLPERVQILGHVHIICITGGLTELSAVKYFAICS